MEEPKTIISIIAAGGLLFAYLLKLIVPYFLRRLEEKDNALERKDEYIRKITSSFLEANNHKTTKFTEALDRMSAAQREATQATINQTEIFKKLIGNQK